MEGSRLRRAILTVAILAAVLAGNTVPAAAIPPGETLLVPAYFSDPSKTTLVGQQWYGCGQPPGSWGSTSPYRNVYFTPC